jgi:hypothetical protein
MKLLKLLIALFAVMNGILFYMFMLHLPFGADAFLLSIAHWENLAPRSEISAVLGVVVAVIAILAANGLGEEWKNRLLFWRWQNAHPAFNAFLNNRRQPFEASQLMAAFPAVKDSGFNRKVQLETWHALYRKHQQEPVIATTQGQWMMQRDFYLVAVVFLLAFLLAWPVNAGIPFNIASAYMFVFGAQFLFLLFMARRVGLRLVDNLLGVALGITDEESGKGGRRKA